MALFLLRAHNMSNRISVTLLLECSCIVLSNFCEISCYQQEWKESVWINWGERYACMSCVVQLLGAKSLLLCVKWFVKQIDHGMVWMSKTALYCDMVQAPLMHRIEFATENVCLFFPQLEAVLLCVLPLARWSSGSTTPTNIQSPSQTCWNLCRPACWCRILKHCYPLWLVQFGRWRDIKKLRLYLCAAWLPCKTTVHTYSIYETMCSATLSTS